MGTAVGMVRGLAYWRFGVLVLFVVDETVTGHVIECAFCGDDKLNTLLQGYQTRAGYVGTGEMHSVFCRETWGWRPLGRPRRR